jgi:phosphoadenosine phosphosulfate reductase
VELDEAHGGIVKVNPIADWTKEQVWEHVRAKKVPFSALYEKGYTSIGCAPCTRAIEPGEPDRAGRWWWEDPDSKECGLHAQSPDERFQEELALIKEIRRAQR